MWLASLFKYASVSPLICEWPRSRAMSGARVQSRYSSRKSRTRPRIARPEEMFSIVILTFNFCPNVASCWRLLRLTLRSISGNTQLRAPWVPGCRTQVSASRDAAFSSDVASRFITMLLSSGLSVAGLRSQIGP